MADEAALAFKSEEEKENALLAIPDEPPQGVDIEEWQREQEEKVQQIMDAPISEEADSGEVPKTKPEEPPATKKEEGPSQPTAEVGEDDFVDFSQLGKVKRSELPEALRGYKNGQEILKQAEHARRFANKADARLKEYEEKIVKLESTAKTVPELQKQLDEIKKASDSARKSVDSGPQISRKQRTEFNAKLDAINAQISKLNEYGGDDAAALQSAMTGTVDTFKDTLAELDSVQNEFTIYRTEQEKRYKTLEERINNVSESTEQAERRRRIEKEHKDAEMGLARLQEDHPELKTTKPLYSDDRNDLETSIVDMARRVYGRRPYSFDEVNRLVGAFNTKDPELVRLCEVEGISPADFGITESDIRNYGILMNIYWNQRGERIDQQSGKRVDVKDWRGKKVIFPDFEAAFNNMKQKGGITQAEQEMKLIEAEKRGQQTLDSSLRKRDTSTPILEPTGSPPEGTGLSEEAALEVIGENPGRYTVDEEKMEVLCRAGDKRGWDMFDALKRAHEALEMPEPKPEPHWRTPA